MRNDIRCRNCKFYEEKTGEKVGYCRRYPTPVFTTYVSWCGEYLSKIALTGQVAGTVNAVDESTSSATAQVMQDR
jgi:hypothetical protein